MLTKGIILFLITFQLNAKELPSSLPLKLSQAPVEKQTNLLKGELIRLKTKQEQLFKEFEETRNEQKWDQALDINFQLTTFKFALMALEERHSCEARAIHFKLLISPRNGELTNYPFAKELADPLFKNCSD